MPSKGFTHESTKNESKEWYTPVYIFDALSIGFNLDPCSPGADVVPWIPALHHYTVEDDGLIKEWSGSVWMNPPYGSDTPRWMNKLCNHGNGIALVFARTDTRWFHAYVPRADAICFIKGRIQFIPAGMAEKYVVGDYKPNSSCGAASMLVGYGQECAEAVMKCELGLNLRLRNTGRF